MFDLTDMKMIATCLLLPDAFGEDSSLFVVVNNKVCSMSMIIGLIFNTINWSRMVAYFKVMFCPIYKYAKFNKCVYCNMMVKLRHIVLFSYFPSHGAVTLIFFIQVQVSTPVLEVKNPFNMDVCEFSLYLEKERLTKVDDCVTALAALIASFHVFGIECPRGLSQTLNFLETLIFDAHSPYSPTKEKEKEVGFQHPVT